MARAVVDEDTSGEGVSGEVGGGVGGEVTVAGVGRFPGGSEWARVVLEMVTRGAFNFVRSLLPFFFTSSFSVPPSSCF